MSAALSERAGLKSYSATETQVEGEAPRELRTRLTVSTATAAAALGVGRERIRAAIAAGTVQSIVLGREIRVPSSPLLHLLGLDAPAVEERPEMPAESS